MRQKNLKWIPLILACIVSFALVNVAQAPVAIPEVSVDPPENIGDPGMYFTISINVVDVVDMYSWGLKIGWNRDLLEYVDANEGDMLMFQPEGSTFVKVPSSDNIDAGCSTLGAWPGVSGSGTLMTATFHVLDAGRTALDIYDSTLLDSLLVPMVHTTEDGHFETNAAANVVKKGGWPEHHHFDISVQLAKDGDANQTLYSKVKNIGALPLYVYVTFEIVRDNGIIETPTSDVITLGPGTEVVLSADYGPISTLDAGKHYASASVWFSYTGTSAGYWEQGTKIKTFSFAVVP